MKEFNTILPDTLIFSTEKITPVSTSIQAYDGDTLFLVDGGSHASKQMAKLNLINHPIVTEEGCTFIEEHIENCDQGIFQITNENGGKNLYSLHLVETSTGQTRVLYAFNGDQKTIFGIFEASRDKTTNNLYISSPAKPMDRNILLNEIETLTSH